MLVKALEYDGLIENPDWVYRWGEHEWGAKGVSHFCKADQPITPSRIIMDHILDRLGIEPDDLPPRVVPQVKLVWPQPSGPDLAPAMRAV